MTLSRKGLDLLLARFPDADVTWIASYPPDRIQIGLTLMKHDVEETPWLWVVLGGENFAIWKVTGAVYRVEEDGAVEDDPFLVPEDSPYRRAGWPGEDRL